MRSVLDKLRNQKGFTLIELLVVITILGILAGILLIGVNPLEQLARGRDSSRKNMVAQLGHALESYVTNQAALGGNAGYYATSATWQETLVNSSEIKSVATAPEISGRHCGTSSNRQGDICYVVASVGGG